MFWFSSLLTEEFIDYFENRDSVYFTVTSQGKIYHKIFEKFKNTVWDLTVLFNECTFEDSMYYRCKETRPDLYKLAERFFKDKRKLDYTEIFHSIKGNMFECDINYLDADQLAVGLMFPFWSRMGGSFEDSFAESGRLRQFVLALYHKSLANDK